MRIKCGTIKPINPIGPASAVVDAHKRTPAKAVVPRTRVTFKPSAVADSSPSAKVLREGARAKLSPKPRKSHGRARKISS